jgi:hypothetical protein
MKYGTHSAMQSTIASAMPVEISIAQLLPVAMNLRCKPRAWPRTRLGATASRGRLKMAGLVRGLAGAVKLSGGGAAAP